MYHSTTMALALSLVAIVAGAQDAATTIAPLPEQLRAEGEVVYRRQCVRCHGDKGQGLGQSHDAAPRLKAGKSRLSVQRITTLVTFGGSYMPRFPDLSDREVAAVATYVRTSFGNDHGPATEAEVASYR